MDSNELSHERDGMLFLDIFMLWNRSSNTINFMMIGDVYDVIRFSLEFKRNRENAATPRSNGMVQTRNQ